MQLGLLWAATLVCALSTVGAFDTFLYTENAGALTWTVWQTPFANGTNQLYVTAPGANESSGEANGDDLLVATVIYNASLFDQGWDFFQVTPNDASNFSQYYVAGFGEGYVTHDRLTDVYAQMSNYTLTPKAQHWLETHIEYMQTQSMLVNQSNPFWVQVGNLLTLMQGIADGYTAASAAAGSNASLSFSDVFKMNFNTEYGDVELAVNDELYLTSPAGIALQQRRHRDQHCSALVRVAENELYTSHDTWDVYQNTIRAYKVYAFDVATVAFSGMVGMIASGDDWYITSNLLAVQETTIGNDNASLAAEYVVPDTVSEFLRVMTATYLATSGSEWVDLFAYNNSGTYCNQWMVVNYNLYSPGQTGDALQDGLLFVAEQLPGNVTSGDMTSFLRQDGYWGSYNIPYFKNIQQLALFSEQEAEYGTFFSWSDTPRAQIFRRDAPQVQDLADMQAIMRYNSWTHDDLSTIPNCSECDPKTSPMLAIASRGDLVPTNAKLPNNSFYKQFFDGPDAFGAVDCKITSSQLINIMQGVVISGPTLYNDNPVFSWTGAFAGLQPTGVPLAYNFTWQWYNQVVPMHGYFDGLSSNKDVIIGAVCGTLGGTFVVTVVVLMFRKKRVAAEYEALV